MTTKTDTEQLRAEFEAWFKETDHFLSELDFCLMPDGRYEDDDVEVAWEAYQAGRAALQSQDREDAERYRYLSSVATQQADTLGPIFRIDVRRTPQTMFNFDAAVDHARRIEKEKS